LQQKYRVDARNTTDLRNIKVKFGSLRNNKNGQVLIEFGHTKIIT
jgi:exosome complex RNA-binding protein Rrp42 (RNase PH superfamily)